MYNTQYHKNDLSNYRFLVTGGAGFIGSHLVEYLLKYGAKKVRIIDNLSNSSLDNLAPFLDRPACEFFKGDITLAEDCELAVAGGIDFVLHQAALGSVPRSIKNPLATHEANVTGTLNMMHAAAKANVKKFIYASSSSVYGDHPGLPKIEDKTGNPLSPYAASKKACELYGYSFWESYKLPTVGLRYFNVYGPRQNPDSPYAAVIPLFAKAVLEKKSPIIFGDGEQARDFTFIENVVQANIKACISSDRANGEVFNVGNQKSTTVNQLAQTLIALSGNSLNLTHQEIRKGDVRFSLADISKAKELIEYNPQVEFSEGLKLTFEWYRNNINAINKSY